MSATNQSLVEARKEQSITISIHSHDENGNNGKSTAMRCFSTSM